MEERTANEEVSKTTNVNIKRKMSRTITGTEKQMAKLRVAAYVRVSAESVQTQRSLQAQTAYYEQMIADRAEWKFAGIYADNGISGTRIRQREGFCRMLGDCEAGKIDKILVKSVSRFARNTVDLLQTVRRLRSLGISVVFEEQQIDSMTEKGELMLTLAASIAQAESESISENAKWAIRKAFQRGIGNTKRRTFGYCWSDGKQIVIPEEAEAVRRIFTNFLSGMSHRKTAAQLNQEGNTTANGNPFSTSAVSTILRNITYTGNTLLQKTYVLDPISKKKMNNTGELPQYLVPDSHEAIIDMETFQRVQEKLAQNRNARRFPYNHTGQQYPFTGKITCGICGRHYTRQLWHTGKNGKKRPTWICTGKKTEPYRRCSAKNLSEEALMEASAAILGIPVFDETCFRGQVESILVRGAGELSFILKDGTVQIRSCLRKS